MFWPCVHTMHQFVAAYLQGIDSLLRAHGASLPEIAEVSSARALSAFPRGQNVIEGTELQIDDCLNG